MALFLTVVDGLNFMKWYSIVCKICSCIQCVILFSYCIGYSLHALVGGQLLLPQIPKRVRPSMHAYSLSAFIGPSCSWLRTSKAPGASQASGLFFSFFYITLLSDWLIYRFPGSHCTVKASKAICSPIVRLFTSWPDGRPRELTVHPSRPPSSHPIPSHPIPSHPISSHLISLCWSQHHWTDGSAVPAGLPACRGHSSPLSPQ